MVCNSTAGTTVNLGYGSLNDALVYATGGKFDQLRDSSLIELGLPVGKQIDTSERLGYWPSYHHCTQANGRLICNGCMKVDRTM